eukprot:540834-Prymnesium_polylepis.3
MGLLERAAFPTWQEWRHQRHLGLAATPGSREHQLRHEWPSAVVDGHGRLLPCDGRADQPRVSGALRSLAPICRVDTPAQAARSAGRGGDPRGRARVLPLWRRRHEACRGRSPAPLSPAAIHLLAGA